MTGKNKTKSALSGGMKISAASLVTVLLFAGLWLFGETGIYNDSNQYIAMHIHREPAYSFFLWMFRSLIGENGYLEAVRLLQNALAAFSVLWLSEELKKQFGYGSVMELLVSLLLLSPHIITPLSSESGLVLSNGIVSEALGLPLFYLFAAQCMRMIWNREKSAGISALLLALLLSLVRGQMMFAILLWLVAAAAVCMDRWALQRQISDGQRSAAGRLLLGRLAACILCTVLAFGGRGFLVKSYNLAFNGHFINNTFGSVGMLANVLYAADREDGKRIKDQEAREFFYLSYDLAEERGANYKSAPEGFLNRAAHLEKWHDALKFEMIEEPWRLVHDSEGFTDYIPENVESDRIAGEIMAGILPAVFGRWLYDYLALSAYGLIRSVAVVHPVLNWYALIAYAGMAALAVWTLVKNRESKTARFAVFSVLAVLANVYATSLIIMCLSRYMIYGLPLFYTGGLLLVYENIRQLKKDESFI